MELFGVFEAELHLQETDVSLWIRILAEAACEEMRAASAMIKTSERANPPLFAGSLACLHSRSDSACPIILLATALRAASCVDIGSLSCSRPSS